MALSACQPSGLVAEHDGTGADVAKREYYSARSDVIGSTVAFAREASLLRGRSWLEVFIAPSSTGTAKVWELETGRLLHTLAVTSLKWTTWRGVTMDVIWQPPAPTARASCGTRVPAPSWWLSPATPAACSATRFIPKASSWPPAATTAPFVYGKSHSAIRSLEPGSVHLEPGWPLDAISRRGTAEVLRGSPSSMRHSRAGFREPQSRPAVSRNGRAPWQPPASRSRRSPGLPPQGAPRLDRRPPVRGAAGPIPPSRDEGTPDAYRADTRASPAGSCPVRTAGSPRCSFGPWPYNRQL